MDGKLFEDQAALRAETPEPEQKPPDQKTDIGMAWKPGAVFLKIGDLQVRFTPAFADRMGRQFMKMSRKARK